MPRRFDDPFDEHGQDRRVPDEERQHWQDMTPGATDEYRTNFGRSLGVFDSVCTACGRDLAAQECCVVCGDPE